MTVKKGLKARHLVACFFGGLATMIAGAYVMLKITELLYEMGL